MDRSYQTVKPVMQYPHLKMTIAGSVNASNSRMALATCTSVEEKLSFIFTGLTMRKKLEMERLATNCLPPEPVPQVVALPKQNWIKIGHLNIRSYLAKQEDIMKNEPMSHANIMCFTETFFKPHQHIGGDLLPNEEDSEIFRLDRVATSSQDLSNGGIMIVCPSSLLPDSTVLQ